MQRHYQEEADLELEILQRIQGDVDRLVVQRKNRCRHLGNEEEYHRMKRKMSEQNKGRGTEGAFDQERETRNQHRESESQERQQYAREREEEIEFQQSEPYPSPMSEPDPPTRPVSPSQEGMKGKTKVSISEYRSRQLQQEVAREREERDQESEHLLKEEQQWQRESIEAQKLELARLHEIEIQQAEIARIKYEQEQLRLEQEHVQKEQEANAKLLTSQARHTPVVFGSHTPCYDKHGQELDYHDDVPAASDSQEAKVGTNTFINRNATPTRADCRMC